MFGGLDAVAASLGLAFRYLAEHPELRATLTRDSSKLPAAVDEIFRRLSVPLTSRRVKADVEIAGVTLKAGDYVLLPLMLHGLDEREYPEPMEFDLDRKQHATSTFGNGYHMCPGRLLARTEMTIAIDEWLARIPEFAIPEGEEVTMLSGGSMIVNNLPLRWNN